MKADYGLREKDRGDSVEPEPNVESVEGVGLCVSSDLDSRQYLPDKHLKKLMASAHLVMEYLLVYIHSSYLQFAGVDLAE